MVEQETIATSFIILGILLLLIEAASPGFFVAVPATVLILLGVVALVLPTFDIFSWQAPALALLVGLPATGVTLWIYRKMAPADRPPVTTSADTLVGQKGVVVREVCPDDSTGKVRLGRQEWSATSSETLPVGVAVEVEKVDGVVLRVVRSKERGS